LLFIAGQIFNMEEMGVSKGHTALRLLNYSIPKLRLYIVQEGNKPKRSWRVQTPSDAARLLAPLRVASEEYFISLHLNAKHEVIGLHEVSHGTLSASLVHPREVYKAALVANSFAILVCHNHPSGSNLTPSKEDFATTQKLVEAGRLLGVDLVDHLIIGPRYSSQPKEGIFSFRYHHPDLWVDSG
jgi:DNA repair protein RadC